MKFSQLGVFLPHNFQTNKIQKIYGNIWNQWPQISLVKVVNMEISRGKKCQKVRE